jgi:hypothetical protein
MANKKVKKRTNNDVQNMHIKLKIELHESHYKRRWAQVLQMGDFLLQ